MKEADRLRNAAYGDAKTRLHIKAVVLPTLRKDAHDLAKCREQCNQCPEWRDAWREAGMLAEERKLLDAIAYAEQRLSA